MKRFIVSMLCVSVFFIGLGSLAEKAGAKFKSDERALALIAQARQAIGGDTNIKNVRSMTITGTSTHTFTIDGVQRTEPGSLEINFELPNKFGKMIRIGNPENAAGRVESNKQVDTFILRRGDGAAEFKITDGENVSADGKKKIIIKKDDGTIEELGGDGDKNIIVRRLGDDKAVFSTDGESINADGKKILITKDADFAKAGMNHNEMFRTVFSLLLTAPDGVEANYLYGGESSVDGFAVNVVEVQSAGSVFKLYLDKSSHLVRMLSYQGFQPIIMKFNKEADVSGAGKQIFERKLPEPEMAEVQVKFSDFRSVSGLQLPHRWTQTVGGNPGETVDITSYEINPANIAEKFKEVPAKVLIRKEKPQQ